MGKPGAVRKARKKRSAIPVATPVVPSIPIAKIVEEKPSREIALEKPRLEEGQKPVSTPQEDLVPTTDKQKKKIEKELKSKQKEIAKQEKKEKEKEERENKKKKKKKK